jgi:hypothetical protein
LLFTSHPLFFFSRFVLNVSSAYDSQSNRRHGRPRRRRRLFVVTIKHSLTFLYNIYICVLLAARSSVSTKYKASTQACETYSTHDNI